MKEFLNVFTILSAMALFVSLGNAGELREVGNYSYDFQMPMNAKEYSVKVSGEAYRMVGDSPVCDYVDGKVSYDARDLGIHEFDRCPDLRIVPLTEMRPSEYDRNGHVFLWTCTYGKIYEVFWTDKSRLCPEALVRFKIGFRTIDEIDLERDGIESTDLGMQAPVFIFDDDTFEKNPHYKHKVYYDAEHGGIIAQDETKPKQRW